MLSTWLYISTLLFIVLNVVFVLTNNVRSKIVYIDQGPVKGFKSSEGNFLVFYGIPYATAPTGLNRFKAPLPAPTWTEIFEAIDDDIFCPQAPSPFVPKGKRIQRENCLVANVFVPDSEKTNLPVLVIVHGGAYQIGQGNILTPHALVDQGQFIVVNFNYRLGALGFLCLGTEGIPGNAGMKDQVALLRWVKKNIASFGGNPDDVTISGYSAGSSAVELLMLSEVTEGLFHKVIPESGAAVGVWSVQIDPIENAKTYARKFNITSEVVGDLEEFYKNADIRDLTMESFQNLKDSTFLFVPCVERDTGTERFLKEAPVDILKGGKFPKMPVLIGFANMEGLFRATAYSEWKNEMNENFSNFLPADMAFIDKMQREQISQRIKKFYFANKPVSNDSMLGYVNYFSDVIFTYGILRSVKLQIETGNKNIFLYEYSYVDSLLQAFVPFPFNSLHGAMHCAESYALLEAPSFGIDLSTDSADSKNMKFLMRKLWINFVKTGEPVSEVTSDFPMGWPPVSSSRSPYMALNIPPELKEKELLADRFEFWDNLYKIHYRKPVSPPVPLI